MTTMNRSQDFPLTIKSMVAIVLIATCFYLSLHYRIFSEFFFYLDRGNPPGIDFFSLPKGYSNLLNGVSIYATWDPPAYPGIVTWYLSHPALVLVLGPVFEPFAYDTSYELFVIFSLCLLVVSGVLFSRFFNSQFAKVAIVALTILSFPAYLMLYVGNVHSILLLALSLFFVGLLKKISVAPNSSIGDGLILLGLLLSLFSKPIVLLFLVPLSLAKETNTIALKALVIYVIVSFSTIYLRFLNPEDVSIFEVLYRFDVSPDLFNIYEQKFILNKYLRTNWIHWLNILAASDFKLNHIEVFSLSNLYSKITGIDYLNLASKAPIILTLIPLVGIGKIPTSQHRLRLIFLLSICLTINFFLSYNIVWEYQYATMMPITVALITYRHLTRTESKLNLLLILLCLLSYLPSSYFIVRGAITPAALIFIEASRVLPMVIIQVAALYILYRFRYSECRL